MELARRLRDKEAAPAKAPQAHARAAAARHKLALRQVHSLLRTCAPALCPEEA